MDFDPRHYGERVARILALDGGGCRLMPLVAGGCSSREARKALQHELPEKLFPDARRPSAALAGLWLYFSAFEEAHRLAQDDHSAEGSLWHAILHRQEPDSGNSAYWFKKAGSHETHKELSREARPIVSRYPGAEFRPSQPWDPFGFILFCERAREQPGSASELAALDIQLAEWQLLFDYCARVKD
jgi:hypothetical protein